MQNKCYPFQQDCPLVSKHKLKKKSAVLKTTKARNKTLTNRNNKQIKSGPGSASYVIMVKMISRPSLNEQEINSTLVAEASAYTAKARSASTLTRHEKCGADTNSTELSSAIS